MKSKTAVTCLLCLATTAGCARHPGSVQASYVNPSAYQDWSCDQLFDEKERLTAEVERVAVAQRKNANADVALVSAGAVLAWPILIGLAVTKDHEDELARLKGEYEAVDDSMRTKQCTLPPPTVTEPTTTTAAPATPVTAEPAQPTAADPRRTVLESKWGARITSIRRLYCTGGEGDGSSECKTKVALAESQRDAELKALEAEGQPTAQN